MSWATAFGLSPGPALRSISDQELRRQLTQNPEWISAWFGNAGSVPLLKMTKSWRVSRSTRQINETSKLSGPSFELWMDRAEEGAAYPWKRAHSALDSPHLHSIWMANDKSPTAFKQVTPSAFLIEFAESFVLIFRSQSQHEPGPEGLSFPIFETPWPFHPDFIFEKPLLGPAPGPRRAVISRSQRKISVSPRFPRALKSAIIQATSAWNSEIGQTLFAIQPDNTSPLTFWECFLPGHLCIDWIGNDNVPLKGLSAATQLTYHPGTGERLGANIAFFNPLKDDTAVPQSSGAETSSSLQLPRPGPTAIKETLSLLFAPEGQDHLLHPFPLDLVQSLLIHELGHDLGLRHDFSASVTSTIDPDMRPTSVMDYFPWPLLHLIRKPGPVDIQRVKVLLGITPQTPEVLRELSSDCTDQSVGSTMECMGGDWGAPSEWILAAADIAPSLQAEIHITGGHNVLIPSRFTIQNAIVRLLNEPAKKSPLDAEQTRRLRSRLNQMPTVR